MWTEITRPKYERDGLRYAGDLTCADRNLIEPYMPPTKAVGRPRTTDLRKVVTFVKVVLGGFCRDTHSMLLVPWHPSYAGQERGDGSGWSVAWHSAPRVKDQIKRKGDSDAFELTAEKRNHGALPQPITLHYGDGAMLPLVEFDLSEQGAELRTAGIEVVIFCAEPAAA